jgi:hypothetical protein
VDKGQAGPSIQSDDVPRGCSSLLARRQEVSRDRKQSLHKEGEHPLLLRNLDKGASGAGTKHQSLKFANDIKNERKLHGVSDMPLATDFIDYNKVSS